MMAWQTTYFRENALSSLFDIFWHEDVIFWINIYSFFIGMNPHNLNFFILNPIPSFKSNQILSQNFPVSILSYDR